MAPLRLAVTSALFLASLPASPAQSDSPPATGSDPIREAVANLLGERQPEPWEEIDPLPTREEIEKRLAELDAKQDADNYLPLALNYLARMPRGEKFSYHLWRSAAFSEWIERAGNALGDEPIFPALLELGEKLPKTDPYYFESRFLRAVDLARKGDLKGQRRILLTEIKEPTFPDNFIPSFKSAIADSLEVSGDIEKAIKTGGSLADRMDSSSKACDAVLRAALLALESGDKALGLDLLKKVAAAPLAARGKATSNEIIREFAALLTPPEALESHWASSEKWWPAWKKLEGQLKLPPAPVAAPLVADTREHRRKMSEAAAKGDIVTYFKGYRELAHAARWLPSAVATLTDSTSLATRRLRPDLGDDFRDFMVTVHENFSSDVEDLQRRHEFYFAVYLLETDQAKRALQVVEEFGARPQKNDALSQGMLQLWALCSQRTGGDLTRPTGVLEALLEGEEPVLDRPSAVKALAQLYSAQNLTGKEEILLERELEMPGMKENPEIFETLTRRHQTLALLGGAGKRFGAALEQWKLENLPPWFEFADPKSLDDPNLADLESILRNPLTSLSVAESVKLRLLAASSDLQPLDRRFETFTGAVETLLGATITHAEYDKLIRSVIDVDSFPSSVRVHFLWRGILEALNRYRPDAGGTLLSHPLAKRLSAEQKEAIETFQPFLETDSESADSLWKLYVSTTKSLPLSRGQVSATLEIFSRILQLGEIEKAEAIYKASESFTIAPDVTSKESFRMNMLRLLDIAKKSRAMNRAAAEAVLATFPPDKITRPEILDSLRNIHRLRNLPDSQILSIQTYLTKAGLTGLATSDFWHDLIRSLGGGSDHLDLSLALIKAMLDHAPTDLERSLTILRSTELIDADDPESLKRLRVLLEPFRGPKSEPLTKDALVLLDLGLDLRAGKEVDIDSVLSGLKHPIAAEISPRIRLLHHRLGGDTDALRNAVQDLDPDTLLKRSLLPISIPALRAAGLDAELELATERARNEVPRAFVDSWLSPDSGSCLTALGLAETLGEPKNFIPPGWLDHALATIGNQRAALAVKAEHARLIGDWETALAAADEAIKTHPTYYHFYFLKGEALHELGRDDEATEFLKTYTRYAKDEDHYPDALRILSTFQTPTGQKPN